MYKINWVRLLIGGFVATVILFFSDGFIHERLLDTDWKAVYAGIRATPPQPHGLGLLYFLIFELGRGYTAIFLYVLMRPLCGVGPKTAVCAGILAWLAFSITGPAQFIPLGFFSNTLWLKVSALHLITSVVATIAGAALYKDAVTPAVAHSG